MPTRVRRAPSKGPSWECARQGWVDRPRMLVDSSDRASRVHQHVEAVARIDLLPCSSRCRAGCVSQMTIDVGKLALGRRRQTHAR